MTTERLPRVDAAAKKGGWLFDDKALIKEQRGVVFSMIKQVGQNLIQARDLINISFPVYLFEPRSYLERMADGWCYAPVFLTRASQAEDPLERFKLVVTFALSGLHNTCKQKKPFNPILGETFEATFEDGSQIYCEQSCHHPPISSWQYIGPDNIFHFFGYGEWTASFRANALKGHQKGPHYVEFPDGTLITYNLPEIWVRGMLWGDRIIEYAGSMKFRDEKHNLYCEIIINPPSTGFLSFFRARQHVTDYFEGEVSTMDPETKKPKDPICRVHGSWLGCVYFDGKPYWEHTDPLKLYRPIYNRDSLPSDATRREDLVFLKAGDKESAQEWKVKLEQIQRHDAKLRKDGTKLRKKEERVERKEREKRKKRENKYKSSVDEETKAEKEVLSEAELKELEQLAQQSEGKKSKKGEKSKAG